MASTTGGQRRAAVRDRIIADDVAGVADLAARLQAHGMEVAPEELRGHLRALGVVRVAGPDGGVRLAVPVDRERAARVARPSAQDTGDDRVLQLTVLAVAAVFLLVGLVGWLLA